MHFTALVPACTLSPPSPHMKRRLRCMPHPHSSRSPLREILGKLRQRPSFIPQSTSMLKNIPFAPTKCRHSWNTQHREGITRSRGGCPLPQRLNLQHRGERCFWLRKHYFSKIKTQRTKGTMEVHQHFNGKIISVHTYYKKTATENISYREQLQGSHMRGRKRFTVSFHSFRLFTSVTPDTTPKKNMS